MPRDRPRDVAPPGPGGGTGGGNTTPVAGNGAMATPVPGDGDGGGGGENMGSGGGGGTDDVPNTPGVFDADSANPDRNKVIAGSICDRLSTIQCEGEEFCCDAPGRDYGTCKAVMLEGCMTELMADDIAAQPIAGFDPVAAEAAFTEIERLASICDASIASFGESLMGLRGIFKGTLEADASCTPLNPLNRAAAGASLAACMNAATTACLPRGLSWRCSPRADVGGNCFSDANCIDGLFCDNPDFEVSGSTCMVRKAPGTPCVAPNECTSLACKGGSCAEPGVQAAYCLAN
jgi:hypothetical protein